MSKHPRLVRRGETYYHRAKVPTDIKGTYGKSEEMFSLKTKDLKEALKRVRVAAVEVDQRFDAHREELRETSGPALEELSDAQLKRIEDIYFAHLLEEDEETRIVGFYDPELPAPYLPAPTFEEYAADIEALDALNRHDTARMKPGFFFLHEAEEVLSWTNVNLKLIPDSPSWKKVALRLQAASILAAKVKRGRNLGEPIETPPMPGEIVTENDTLFSAAVEQYIAEKSRTSWNAKTADIHKTCLESFIAINGDKSLAKYGRADGSRFKSVYMRLPSNWKHNDILKRLPIDKAADRAEELGLSPMAHTTTNKQINTASAFWNWAENHFDDAPRNPMKGLKLARSKRAKDERDPFTLEELQLIFRAPLFTGCKSSRYTNQPGDHIPRDSGIYWLPLLGLLTGARMGELIQLHTADVQQHKDIIYLDLNEDGEGKTLKTATSKRAIPVHHELIRLGFLEHVAMRRERKDKRLFPEMAKAADGYYSSNYSPKFVGLLKALRVKTETNAFHSFRHSFEDAGRESDVMKELRDALLGHGEEGMSARYGKGYYVEKLNEAMQTISYKGLDLTHLYLADTVVLE